MEQLHRELNLSLIVIGSVIGSKVGRRQVIDETGEVDKVEYIEELRPKLNRQVLIHLCILQQDQINIFIFVQA